MPRTMPSTLVHMALAALLAAALLGAAFHARSLAVVVGLTAMADLDAFASLVMAGAHRTLLHTLVLPALLGGLILYDTRIREASSLRRTWNGQGPRVAGVAVFAFAFSAIGLDMTTNGVNALWPLVDQFYVLDGKFVLSTTEGIVQTFVDLSPETGGVPSPESIGNTSEVHLGTGVDPTPGAEPENVERIFPVVRTGWQALVLGLGVLVPALRLREGSGHEDAGTVGDEGPRADGGEEDAETGTSDDGVGSEAGDDGADADAGEA